MMDLSYSISDRFLAIHESHQAHSKEEMKAVLVRIRRENADKNYAILNRTDSNIIHEWRAHNLFYDLHVLRLHTRTVDLEYPQRWWFKVAYWVASGFYSVYL